MFSAPGPLPTLCLPLCHAVSARKVGQELLKALDARRAEQGSAASDGVSLTAAAAGLVQKGAAVVAADSDTAAQRDTGVTA
jgi:hypothetical protein